MRGDEIPGGMSVHCNQRARKGKKKASSKALGISAPKRTTVLLHKLRTASGNPIRKKVCTKCGEKKWLTKFSLNHKPGVPPGYRSECIQCHYKMYDGKRHKYKKRALKRQKEKVKEERRQLLIQCPNYHELKRKEKRMQSREDAILAREALIDRDCS